jgi:hypothetical protein
MLRSRPNSVAALAVGEEGKRDGERFFFVVGRGERGRLKGEGEFWSDEFGAQTPNTVSMTNRTT